MMILSATCRVFESTDIIIYAMFLIFYMTTNFVFLGKKFGDDQKNLARRYAHTNDNSFAIATD